MTIPDTPPVKRNPRHMEARLYSVARDVGVFIDSELSMVQKVGEDHFRIIASLDSFPQNEEERSLLQSSFHATLLDEFEGDGIPNLEIQIVVPPPLRSERRLASSSNPNLLPSSIWMSEQYEGVKQYIRDAIREFLIASCWKVLIQYPWRDFVSMRANFLHFVQSGHFSEAIANARGKSNEDLLQVCFSTFLPPIEAIVPPFDRDVILCEAMSVYGKGLTLLEVYEAVYYLSLQNATRSKQMRFLCSQLFV